MSAYRIKTYGDIINAVSRRIKIPTTDAKFVESVKEAINTRNEAVSFMKKWRWMMARHDLVIKGKHTDGTVSLTNEDREVTGTGSLWEADHNGWFISFNDSPEVYNVISIDVAAQTLLLSAPYVGGTSAASSYTMFQYMIGLPPDCEEIDSVWHDYMRTPLEILSPREFIDRAVASPSREGKATAVTAYGFKAYEGAPLGQFVLGYDYLNSSEDNDLRALTYPLIPESDYVLHLDYVIKMNPLDADDDEPLMPVDKRHVLMYGALADMFYRERNNEMGDKYDTKFERTLRKMMNDTESTTNKPILKPDLRRYYSRSARRRRSRGYRFDYE